MWCLNQWSVQFCKDFWSFHSFLYKHWELTKNTLTSNQYYNALPESHKEQGCLIFTQESLTAPQGLPKYIVRLHKNFRELRPLCTGFARQFVISHQIDFYSISSRSTFSRSVRQEEFFYALTMDKCDSNYYGSDIFRKRSS